MPDLISWSFPLTQWARTPVRLHILALLFAASRLALAALNNENRLQGVLETVAWLGLVATAILIHEFAEWCTAIWLGVEPCEIRIWPLGNFVVPSGQAPSMFPERAAATTAGLVTSLGLALGIGMALTAAGYPPQWNPFEEPGKALVSTNPPQLQPALSPFAPVWWLTWFAFVNWVLFLSNLIPALPFDLGRLTREWFGRDHRDREISPYLARVFAGLLCLAGVFRLSFHKPGGFYLLVLALVIEGLVRHETQMLEENGYFEEGAFGYDFSQGYTNLETTAPRAHVGTGSTLQRWRQVQSEERKLRREQKNAAESVRLDEILQKLHESGKSSLTLEERRFLHKLSRKIRARKP